ncbi:hypothetical protein MRX96_004376 [Rhipicephalus microplus]
MGTWSTSEALCAAIDELAVCSHVTSLRLRFPDYDSTLYAAVANYLSATGTVNDIEVYVNNMRDASDDHDATAYRIIEVLASNRNVQKVKLNLERLSDTCCQLIADSILQNGMLYELSLEALGEPSCAMLLQCLIPGLVHNYSLLVARLPDYHGRLDDDMATLHDVTRRNSRLVDLAIRFVFDDDFDMYVNINDDFVIPAKARLLIKKTVQYSPILLLLHGFLDFWFIWNRQIPNLSNHFCVVVPDLRGYGLTTKPTNSADYLMLKLVEDVKQLINFINPPSKNRQLVLVGHDWGAMIGFCLATLHESLISRMIIINGMHPKAFSKQLLRSPRQMRMSWYMIPFRHPRVPEQYLMMRDFAFFDKVHKVFTEREEYIHKYMFSQPGALTGAINYYRAFNNDKEQLNKLGYRVLNIPTLILWGQKDEFLTSRVGTYDREWLSNSSIVFYKRAGHWVLRECSTSVNHYIVETSGNLEPLPSRQTAPDVLAPECILEDVSDERELPEDCHQTNSKTG